MALEEALVKPNFFRFEYTSTLPLVSGSHFTKSVYYQRWTSHERGCGVWVKIYELH